MTSDNPARPGDVLVVYATGLFYSFRKQLLRSGIPIPSDRLYEQSGWAVLVNSTAAEMLFTGPLQVSSASHKLMSVYR